MLIRERILDIYNNVQEARQDGSTEVENELRLISLKLDLLMNAAVCEVLKGELKDE